MAKVCRLVVNPLIVYIRIKPLSAGTDRLRERETGLFTRSSAANIPVNMELCDGAASARRRPMRCPFRWGLPSTWPGRRSLFPVLALAAVHTLAIEVDLATALLLERGLHHCRVRSSGGCRWILAADPAGVQPVRHQQ